MLRNYLHIMVDENRIRTFVLDIKGFSGSVDWDVTKALVFHIGEGRRDNEKAAGELAVLIEKGLLRPGTVIVHGTAFSDADFQKVAEAGAKLVWSPQSNLVLYSQTTDIKSALAHGVPVSLGVDWNLTGSDNVFDELRVAEQVNEEQFDNAIPASDWVKMITLRPAQALALDGFIGSLASGKKADITVLKSKDPDPGQSLLKTHLQDVQMVWVGGDLLYGQRSVLDKVKPGKCEALVVAGSNKEVCVADPDPDVPKSEQTLQDIRSALEPKVGSLAPLAP